MGLIIGDCGDGCDNISLAPAELFYTPDLESVAVTQIDLALYSNLIEGSYPFTVSILTDANSAPGTVLGTWSSSLPSSSAQTNPYITIGGLAGPILAPGTPYYLQVSTSVTAPYTYLAWATAVTLFEGAPPYDSPFSPASPGAFDVLGVPPSELPEPSSMIMTGLGLAGFVAFSHSDLLGRTRIRQYKGRVSVASASGFRALDGQRAASLAAK